MAIFGSVPWLSQNLPTRIPTKMSIDLHNWDTLAQLVMHELLVTRKLYTLDDYDSKWRMFYARTERISAPIRGRLSPFLNKLVRDHVRPMV
jgi:hypothetical protein